MSDDDNFLRAGVRELLRCALKDGGIDDDGAVKLATQLEEACRAANKQRIAYATTYSGLCQALPKKYGDFLEMTLAKQIADGRITLDEAITPNIWQAHLKIEHRQTYKALFYTILARDPRFSEAERRTYATNIERGCFNAAIARCRESADVYSREWSCPMFRCIYSACCAKVLSNLDPEGSIVRTIEGGSWALDQLASGAWRPESLGTMTAAELCPRAGQAERDRVMYRLNQKVDEKTSALFMCPRCHKRNHTYRQVQISTGDEPSTFMCTCKECGQNYEGFV